MLKTLSSNSTAMIGKAVSLRCARIALLAQALAVVLAEDLVAAAAFAEGLVAVVDLLVDMAAATAVVAMEAAMGLAEVVEAMEVASLVVAMPVVVAVAAMAVPNLPHLTP